MTFPGGGGYQYESTQVRALGGITPESYDYRDQAKVTSKLVNDVSYMAGMQRKMQQGIDAANENVIQQIQGLINEIVVLFGGGGDTGFDFGDLKYILQMFGSLFGIEPGGVLPINLFDAAWHFLSTYILPFSNFDEAIEWLFDLFIASALDIFGEVPIVGEAIQQFATFVIAVKDLIDGTIDWVYDIIDNIVSAFGKIPLVGPLVEGVWDTITGLLGIGNGAQDSATTANNAIASLEARLAGLGGITDNFEGIGLPTDYDLEYSGAGTGIVPNLDGSGNLDITLTGTSDRKVLALYTPAELGTDDGKVKMVVKSKADNTAIFTPHSYKYLLARIKDDFSEYIYVKWRREALRMGYCVGGTEYDFTGTAWYGGPDVIFEEHDGMLVELDFTGTTMKMYVDGGLKLNKSSGSIVTTNRGIGWGFDVEGHPLGTNDPGSFAIITGLDAT